MVGRRFDRHEYVLSDEAGIKALLVRGSKPGAGDWWLFQPLQPVAPLSPQQAAAVRWGQTVNFDGHAAQVSELFQSTIRQVESPEASDLNLTSSRNEPKAPESGVVPISSGYRLGFWRGREERGQT